jgi:hypothetical protein
MVFLEAKDGYQVPNFKVFFSGLQMLGKHFLVKPLDTKSTRHYSICNIMRPDLYEELIRLLRNDEKNMTRFFNMIHD